MAERINSYRELRVYKAALDAAMEIFEITKKFPPEEKYSLVDQIRRCSRSVCSNIGEGWRRRRYKAAFVAKLNDSEGEAAETQVWLDVSYRCQYIDLKTRDRLDAIYDSIIGQLVRMVEDVEKWLIRSTSSPVRSVTSKDGV
jgi:four helix bundle protein